MKTDRREFIILGGAITLLAASALSFGESIKPLVEDKEKKVALIYATRYGATQETSGWIAEGLERDVAMLNIEEMDFAKSVLEYDLFIIGSGVWIDGVHRDMIRFLKEYKAKLTGKIIASFILCGTTGNDTKGEERIAQYFHKFHAPLDIKPSLNQKFGGRMIIDKLTPEDRKLLENFYLKVLKREFVDWDRTEPDKAKIFAKEIAYTKFD
ncbi:MAG: flavodoxin domain-containing protein [Campylobacterota bacterium]|nr:flavodoxin domain-containing protein [Campylobacterota bacterium]